VVQCRGFLIVAYSLWWSFGGLIASIVLQVRSQIDANEYKIPIYIQYDGMGYDL
jgi:hypothetical protein